MDAYVFQTVMPFRIGSAYGCDSDFSDRLNFVVTSMAFLLLAIICAGRNYFTKTIGCWLPTEFTPPQVEYSEQTCWVTGLYYWDPNDENLPTKSHPREQDKYWVGYTQWISLVLLLMSALVHLPPQLWRLISRQAGFTLKSIVHVAMKIECETDKGAREVAAKFVAEYISDSLGGYRRKSNHILGRMAHKVGSWVPCICIGRKFGCCLVWLYFMTKAMYMIVLVGEFVIIHRFLNTSYVFFGFELLGELVSGGNWTTTKMFPRIVICEFELRRLANINRYTVQCVLPVNMFAEKIFIIVWFWLALMLLLTLVSTASWAHHLALRCSRVRFVRRYIRVLREKEREKEEESRKHDERSDPEKKRQFRRNLNRFIDEFLSVDGVFLLILIASNAGDMAACRITQELWTKFVEEEKKKRDSDGTGLELAPGSRGSTGGENDPAADDREHYNRD